MDKKSAPKRMCLACRQGKSKNELLRVVKTAEGKIEIDESGKANGRGAYLCRNSECIGVVFKKRLLSRTFKMDAGMEIYETLQNIVSDDE